MKIKVKLGTSESQQRQIVTLEDIGISEQEWVNMSDEQKQDSLNEYVQDLPEQPYWIVENFEEE